MMLYLYVQQNQWIFMTLLIGLALMFLFCLTYQAMWHPRGLEQKSEKTEVTGTRSFLFWLLNFMPWVIILVILGSVFFTIVMIVEKTKLPPNW